MTATATEPFAGTYVADPAHSSFQFAVKHMKVATFRAAFGDVDARLTGDGAALALEGRARVASVSIATPPEFREHVVNGADFLDAGRHPEIAFRSTAVELGADGQARVEGELTVRGVTRPVVATGTYEPPVEDPYGVLRGALELQAVIDRRDWGMGWQAPLPKGGDVLGWDVQLTVHLELIRQG
jgi:polyisoprenoid-binding protein YceI